MGHSKLQKQETTHNTKQVIRTIMKTMKSLIVATLLVAASTLMAQTTRTNNYSAKAIEQTNELVTVLNLSDEQTMVILDINQRYANQEDGIATNSALSKKEAQKALNNLVAAQTEEIKSVLTNFLDEKFENTVAIREALDSPFTPSVDFNSASQTIYFGTDTPNF